MAASQVKAFDAWTKPELMKLWLCPENMIITEVLSENRVNGKYLVVMQDVESSKSYRGGGEFETFNYPESFSLRWKWEGEEEQTQILVEFSKVSGYQTNVYFVQSGFVDTQKAEEQRLRWELIFNHFVKILG